MAVVLERLLDGIESTLECVRYYNSTLHGLPHLREVALLAGKIALKSGTDIESAMVAGFLHDVARKNDYGGNQHALDSAKMARPLIMELYPHLDVEKICYAIECHADGLTTKDPIVGAVWDADRLTLKRLGRTINRKKISTKAAINILDQDRINIINRIKNSDWPTVNAQLQYCIENGFLLHGSRNNAIDVLKGGRDRPCCATKYPTLAILYAISPDEHLLPISERELVVAETPFPFSPVIEIKATKGFIEKIGPGTVYVVEDNRFVAGKDRTEYVAFEPIRPIARIDVEPSDLPCKIGRLSKDIVDLYREAIERQKDKLSW